MSHGRGAHSGFARALVACCPQAQQRWERSIFAAKLGLLLQLGLAPQEPAACCRQSQPTIWQPSPAAAEKGGNWLAGRHANSR